MNGKSFDISRSFVSFSILGVYIDETIFRVVQYCMLNKKNFCEKFVVELEIKNILFIRWQRIERPISHFLTKNNKLLSEPYDFHLFYFHIRSGAL